ncbi:type IV toxin-antitoxin system AbiEi family antitoxin [Treponema primitia]|uniref:type IV toxin-antitoxin system AbiEi family antitoxin n=1 Tax=Treponema primitia TaxID=88058 RepID=UPI0002D57C37|nr:hypothetical protein [Treponema primitia]
MQSIQRLKSTLESLASAEHYLFSASDFYQIFPEMTAPALRVLLGRAAKSGVLIRICRGMYLYPKAGYPKGCELYHTASRLREESFCYLSLESALSEEGMISQIPLGWISLVTGGRSGIIACGKWGSIEFVHTKKHFDDISALLIYDRRYRLWRASAQLALQDMRAAKRSMELINRDAVREFI